MKTIFSIIIKSDVACNVRKCSKNIPETYMRVKEDENFEHCFYILIPTRIITK